MMHSEWDLFIMEEDLEVGDTVEIDDGPDKKTLAVYRGMKTRYTVWTTDENGKDRMFKANTLEEIRGRGFLLGKSKKELRLGKTQ